MKLRNLLLSITCLFAANAAFAACSSQPIYTDDPNFQDYKGYEVDRGYLGCNIVNNGTTYCHLRSGGGLSDIGCNRACDEIEHVGWLVTTARVNASCTENTLKKYHRAENHGQTVTIQK